MGIEMDPIELPEFLATGERDRRQAKQEGERKGFTGASRPRKSAAVDVEPERETPGIKAPTWAIPTVSASESLTFSSVRDAVPSPRPIPATGP